MQNVILTGTIRSGLDVVSKVLAANGWQLDQADYSDFVASRLNLINHRIFKSVTHVLGNGEQDWLALATNDAPETFDLLPEEIDYLNQLPRPFCLTDPRFCITYPYWEPHLSEGTQVVVLFRKPTDTVKSIWNGTLRPPFVLDVERILRSWMSFYQRALRIDKGNFYFLSYEDLDKHLTRLGCHLGKETFSPQPFDSSKSHFNSSYPSFALVEDVYNMLLRRSELTTRILYPETT